VGEGLALHLHRWAGAGPPVLLVHGLASNLHLWDGVAERLAASGHDVVAVDLRGHGRSDTPDGGYDVPTVAGDLAGLVRRLGLHRPVVAGQSWGGNLVVELTWAEPELVGAIACVDGGWIELRRRFPEWDECWEVLQPPALDGLDWAVLEAGVRSGREGWPEPGIAGTLASFERRADGSAARRFSVEHHRLALRGLWEHAPTARFADVRAPVLLVPVDTGEQGWTTGKREGVAEAERLLPRSRTRWFEGDHDVHASQPDEVAALLQELATGAGA